MIPTDRLDKLTIAVTMGLDPGVKNNEEQIYVDKIREEVRQAAKDGMIIRIPPEIPG